MHDHNPAAVPQRPPYLPALLLPPPLLPSPSVFPWSLSVFSLPLPPCLPASYSLLYHHFALRPNPSGSGTGCICMLYITATCSIQLRRKEGELCRALNDDQPSASMWICFVKGYISFYSSAESMRGLTDCSSKRFHLFTFKGESSFHTHSSMSIFLDMLVCILAGACPNYLGD